MLSGFLQAATKGLVGRVVYKGCEVDDKGGVEIVVISSPLLPPVSTGGRVTLLRGSKLSRGEKEGRLSRNPPFAIAPGPIALLLIGPPSFPHPSTSAFL